MLCGHSVPYSGIWPVSGSMRSGRSYPPQRGGHRTGASGFSFSPGLLPTPTRADGERVSASYARGNLTLAGALLPTPNATDGQGGVREVPETRTHRGQDHGPRLRDVAPVLLPTPSVADATGGHVTRSGSRKGEPLLGGIAMLLPTPTAMDSHGARNATANRRPGSAGHAGTTLSDVFWAENRATPLLPTPTARLGDDTSRGADPARYKGPQSLNGRRSNLDDCIAAVEAKSPWLGALTGLPSPGGKPSPEGGHPGQLSLDGQGSALAPGSSSGCRACLKAG